MYKVLFNNMLSKIIQLQEELKNFKKEHRISLNVYKSFQVKCKEFMINKLT